MNRQMDCISNEFLWNVRRSVRWNARWSALWNDAESKCDDEVHSGKTVIGYWMVCSGQIHIVSYYYYSTTANLSFQFRFIFDVAIVDDGEVNWFKSLLFPLSSNAIRLTRSVGYLFIGQEKGIFQQGCIESKPFAMLQHDGETHHPLGSASYYFKQDLVPFIDRHCVRSRITVHIGAQPNSQPHIGNIVTFATAFALASALKERTAREIRIKFVFVETAPAAGQDFMIKGVRYQKSLENMGEFQLNQQAFNKVLERLSLLSGVPCDVETQDFWRKNPRFGQVLGDIISKRNDLGPRLSPETQKLAIRAPCPLCGLADKHGLTNRYKDDGRIVFTCPTHGEFDMNVHLSDQTKHLGLNTPLRNLVRVLLCSEDQDSS